MIPCLLLIALPLQPPCSLPLQPVHLQRGKLTRISSALSKRGAFLPKTARGYQETGNKEAIARDPDQNIPGTCYAIVLTEKKTTTSQRPIIGVSLVFLILPKSDHSRATFLASRPSGFYQVGKDFCFLPFKGRGTLAFSLISHTFHSQALKRLPAPLLPHSRS